ncbi:MAG: acyl carrier protein/NAD(P)-dependent dehydrogenase (short-subunit alcohol dehydrogenase family), partial [Gammaproteobacteria bacterium]
SQQTAQRSIELLIRQQLQASGTALPSQDVEATMPAAALAAAAPAHVPAAPSEVLPAHTAQQSVPSAAQQHDAAQTISAQNVTTGVVAGATTHATTAVMESLLEIVAEKTGYPREVLTVEMSLDADLGIDSIKRVEIFSALADHFPQFAQVSADEAGSLDTLQQIAAHLSASAAPVLTDSVLAPAPALGITMTAPGADVLHAIIEVIADKTGYPSEALNASMRLDEDLGIDSIKRVEILSVLQDLFPDLPNIEADTVGTLQTIAEIGHLLNATPIPTEPAFALDGSAPRQALASTTLGAKSGAEPSTIPSAIPSAVAVHRNDSDEDTGLQIRQVIADKTGYPAEMLDINMQLDADLGIDSIKRVEIFSILQERFPHAPTVEPDTMASLQRIGDIVDYLEGGSTPPKPATSNAGNGAALSCPLDAPRAPQYTAQMSLPTGPGNLAQGLHRLLIKCVPVEANSRESLQMPANAVIGIVADDTPLASALRLAFERRGIFSKLIGTAHPQLEETITGLLIVSPAHVNTNTLSQLFTQLRAYGPQLQRAAAIGPTILAAVSRLNGQFGLGAGADTQAIDQALSGGLGGMLKSAAREWLDVHCKSIDIAPRWDNQQQLAQAIVDEALLGGPLEVGLSPRGPVTLELSAANLPAPSASNDLLKRAELVLVSGGARGITAAIAIALAHRFQPTLLLIGRSPAPQPEADWLHGLDEETAIKQAIHRYHADAQSPKEIEGVYQHTIANRQMLQTIAAIDANGAKAIYRSVDIRSAEQLANTLETVTNEYGPLRGIVHGAGVLADGLIDDKTDQQFAAVLSTKCEGFINLLAAVDDSPPAFIVACSSTTARLGRRGQADYAAANECLNKLAQQAARQHPNSKVLSVNWGPWDGGMVDARLKTIFSKEGVGLIPLDAGAQYLLDELCSVASPQTEHAVEVVILGPTPSQTLACPIVEQPLAIAPLASLQRCYSQDVSVTAMPILGSHVINARAVVPVALIIEWLAHGALHASPGLRFVGLENFRLLKGITVDALQSLNIQVLAGATERQPSDQGVREVITMELRSGEQLHARAQIHLGDSYSNAVTASPPVARTPFTRRTYADSVLFHGAQLQGITRISACDEGGISGESNAAPPPAHWIKAPFRTQWLADPLVLDASFQMMILWAEQIYHHGCLPTSIGRLELYAPFSRELRRHRCAASSSSSTQGECQH